MLNNIPKLLRGYLTICVCILLGGCFKSAPKPNPQMEDTILSPDVVACRTRRKVVVDNDRLDTCGAEFNAQIVTHL